MPSPNQVASYRGDIYSDNGCHLAPSCLNCPFPVCYLDDPAGVQTHQRRLKEREQLAAVEFYTTAVAARKMGVGLRAYFRIVKRVREYFEDQETGNTSEAI